MDDLRRSLLRLTAAEFLYETRMFPDLEYTFKHALTHDVAYGSVLQERRRGLHGRIAAAIEAVYADRLVEHVERLAHHAFQSEAWAKAVGYLREAGAKALGRSVHREASACFEQALVALGHLPETRSTIELGIDLRFDLRVAVAPVGSSLAYVLERMRQAEASAVALDDKLRLARASAYMVESLWMLGDHARAIESGERALHIAEELGDVGLQALTRRYLGGVYHALGEYLRAIDLFRQSLAPLQGDLLRAYFSAPLLTSVGSRTRLAWCLAELGEFAEGLAVVGEAVRIAESVAQPLSLVNAYWGQGLVHICRGELDKAVASLERSLALVQSWSISGWFHQVASPLGQAYALAGRCDDALPLLEQAIQGASARGRVSGHSLYIVRLGQAHLLAGRPEDGLAAARCALQLSRDHRERASEALALGLLADIAARRELPDADQADHYYREALARAGELGMRPLVAHCHLGLGKLYRRTGNGEQAQGHLTTATTMYREMGMRFYLEQAEAEMASDRPIVGQ